MARYSQADFNFSATEAVRTIGDFARLEETETRGGLNKKLSRINDSTTSGGMYGGAEEGSENRKQYSSPEI